MRILFKKGDILFRIVSIGTLLKQLRDWFKVYEENGSSSNDITIINSPGSHVISSGGGGIVGGCCHKISDGGYNGIIGGIGHVIRTSSLKSSILGGAYNSLCESTDSAIVAGRYNCMTGSERSSILGGYCNLINKVAESVILGGFANSIDAQVTKGLLSNVIVAGCKNSICGGYGIIIGGDNNSITSYVKYGTILGGEGNGVDVKISSVIGSCNINTSYDRVLVVTNLIFDKHVHIGSEPTNCGFTGTLNSPTSFIIRKGFITIT